MAALLIADFVGEPQTGRVPLAVKFTDMSSEGNILVYEDDLEVGSYGTEPEIMIY